MTPTGKTEVSKELNQLLKASDDWDEFNSHLDYHPHEKALQKELTQIYALEAKNISGYSAEKCAFVHPLNTVKRSSASLITKLSASNIMLL